MLREVFHNDSDEQVFDLYGQPIGPGRSRLRTGDCDCAIPCKAYVCTGCRQIRSWCCGGAPDVRCDHCVTKTEAA